MLSLAMAIAYAAVAWSHLLAETPHETDLQALTATSQEWMKEEMTSRIRKITVDSDTALATFWVDRGARDADQAMACPACQQTEFEFSALPTVHGETQLIWVRCPDCNEQWDAHEFIAEVEQC
jgi:DNA-directed RNA polymerase subunit M/transcription elongation factor TFIIS